MDCIFVLIVFAWLIFLQFKVKSLLDKNDLLEQDLNYYKTHLKSLEHKIENLHSNKYKSSSETIADSVLKTEPNRVNTKTESSSQIQESTSNKQSESSLNKALSIAKQRTEHKADEPHTTTETTNIRPEIDTKKATDTNSVSEEVISQNTHKKESEPQTHRPQSQEIQTQKEPVSFVQIFSWIGGFILLLGIIFWIKYALENNVISPDLRVALGTIAGIGLWIAGALLRKPEVKTTSDTLCACGLCTCYSAWFAAYYFYHIVPPSLTFILLSIVAIASFATAVWKNAQYIGILAQLIGFVTPFLFPFDSTQIWFVLAYAAIINVTAVVTALKCNWPHQLYTGLAFTFLTFFGIFNTGEPLQLSIFAGIFILLYTAVAASKNNKKLMHCSFVFAFIGLIILALRSHALRYDSLPYVISFAAIFSICFGLLSSWKKNNELCFATLGFAFTAFVLIAFTGSFKALLAFIALTMLFFGFLTAKMDQPYLQIGTIVLASLGSLILFIEQFTISINAEYLPYYAGFSLFFTIFFGLIAFMKKSSNLLINTIVFSLISFTLLQPFPNNSIYVLSIATVFTLFFGILSFKLHNKTSQYVSIGFTTACSVLMCLTYLITKNLNFSIHAILAYSMSATLFFFFIATKEKNGTIFTSASFSMAIPLFILSIDAYFRDKSNGMQYWLFSWSVLITFAIFFLKNYFENNKSALISSAICNIYAALIIKILLCENVTERIQILSGTTALIMSFIYAYLVYNYTKSCNLSDEKDKFEISCLICAPITFLTLAITLYTTKEWKTLAFAIEGLSLIVLWRYFKVNAIQNIGLGLMSVVAIRLLFNPEIGEYYKQTQLIFNWYLYTYTLCAIMLFIGSSFWRESQENTVPKLMRAMGGIIIFALINIEIANYFGKGRGLSFNFCGGLAEAAAYTIAWALYGAICMFNSTQQNRYPLKVGIGLISLALLKLFLSDIWNLSSGLRIVVLIGVAVILLVVSFIYQQFKKQKTVS